MSSHQEFLFIGVKADCCRPMERIFSIQALCWFAFASQRLSIETAGEVEVPGERDSPGAAFICSRERPSALNPEARMSADLTPHNFPLAPQS